MSRRAVEIPVFRSPAGDVVAATVAFRLVDANLIPVLGLDADGEAVIDSAVIVSTAETQSVQLTATDTIEPTALYRVTIASPEHKRNRSVVFLAIIPAGAGEFAWADVVAYGEWLESGSELVDRILPDPTNLPDGHTAVVSGGQWVGSDEVVSINGREIELRVSGNLLQQRYVGDLAWITIFNLATLAGADGRNPELSVVDGYLVYRLAGSSAWIQLYPMASLVGAQGPGTEWRATSTHIQARAVGSTTWANIILLDDLRGADGTSFRILGSFVDLSELSGLTPDVGDGYINSVTGHLWAWDGSAWIDAGEIRGPAGQSPEFAVVDGVASWRYVGETAWTALYSLDDVTGAPGSDADITFAAEGNMRHGGVAGAPTEFPTTTDGRALLAATLAAQKTLLGVPTLPATISQAEAEAGTETTTRLFTALRARQAANAAVSVHETAINHALLATALQPDDVGTAAAEDVGAFDPSGAAAAARAAHETAFDHELLGSALQPDDVHNGVGGLVAVVEAIDAPDEGEPVSVAALPALSARNLLDVDRLLPAYEADRVAAPAGDNSPGTPGQWADEVDAGGQRWRYLCVETDTWIRWAVSGTWENLKFIGPNISPIAAQVGDAISIDVSGRFTGTGRTYALIDAPGWMSINSSGVISGTAAIGSATFTVRATVSGGSVDSNPVGLTVGFFSATDFSEYSDGNWSGTYLFSNANAIPEIAAGGPANSGKVLRSKNNNLTTNLWWSERIEIGQAQIGNADWEVLAMVRVSTVDCRIGIGYMDGTANPASFASLAIQFYDTPPRFIATGTNESGLSGTLDVTPADWLGDYIWMNKRRVGNQTQSRVWKHGEALPAWGMARTYGAGTPPGTGGLGWFMSHRQTDQQLNEMFYFACSVGGAALQVPTWTVPSFPVVEEGAHAYLNTWAAKTPVATAAQARFDAFDHPLVGRGDASADNPNTVLRKLFCLYAATGLSALAGVRSDAFKLVKETPDEYQGNQNTLFAGDRAVNALSLYTDEDELRLYPGHVAFQAGTTVLNAYGAGGDVLTISVADASKIVVGTRGRHALWRKQSGDFSEPETWEWVYVTARNLTTNEITINRGWSGPAYKVGAALRKAHAAGSYICNPSTGGAADAGNTAIGVTGNTWTRNWKFNASSQCPTDSNGTTINDHIVIFVKRRMDEAHAILGFHADGVYQDVDRRGYNSQEGQLDCNNDGIADYGFSNSTPSAVQWWRDGKAAQEAAIIAAIGPGTAYNCCVFMNGTENSDPVLFNGTEGESGFFDKSWEFNQNVQYTRFDQKFLNSLFLESQIESGLGPRTNLHILRAYTDANPCLQAYTSQTTLDDPCVYGAVGNQVARLTMAVTWCIGGIFAMPQDSCTQCIGWWDEYACDTANGYVCPEFGVDSDATLIAHAGWMGKPKGHFVRHYSDAEMALANNLSNVDATSATNPLSMSGCSGARVTSGGPEGAAFWRYTQTAMSTTNFTACGVNRTTTGLTIGQYYTVVIAMKSDRYRRVEANIAGSSQSLGNHPIGDQWLYYPYTFKATETSQNIAIRFGAMLGRLDIGAWYILPGRSHAISRDFDRALVLANPGPDPYTFTLPAGANYQRLLGTQDPAVNDGSAVSGTVVVPARDGLILAKVL